MTNSEAKPIHLIVNADDYGYFYSVSQGILQAARQGAITATGILANGPDLPQQIAWLAECPQLDLGIHLNLTSRQPLTTALAKKLANGQFSSVFAMAGKIATGSIKLAVIRAEWCTQIETILRCGIKPCFLNSHEHIHMLPGLFQLTQELAAEYQIPHVRLTRTAGLPSFKFAPMLRTILLHTLERIHQKNTATNTPWFIGLNGSGQLNLAYLRTLFSKLQPGKTYELMCHPGLFNATEITDPRLLAYHAWENELALLTSPQLKSLYDEFGIHLVKYSA
jgi:hypothetical protein